MLGTVGSTSSGTMTTMAAPSDQKAENGRYAKNAEAPVWLGVFGHATERPPHDKYQQPGQNQHGSDDEHIAPCQLFEVSSGTQVLVHVSPSSFKSTDSSLNLEFCASVLKWRQLS